MAPSKVILLACGSFNPPTNMHLRMFELARDNLNRLGQYLVIGGIVSPVHDAYGKKELVPGTFRCEMLKLALKSSDWIQISDWECSQETWSRTRRVLQYHQNLLNSVLNNDSDSPNNNLRNDLGNGYDYSSWITNDIRNSEGPVQIKLLCGADLLESFATPGLWADEDIETIIGQHGIVVITRQGTDPRRFIYESDILTKYQNNIIIVTEWITNDVSSTKVRRALRRQESVKYLLEDSVIEFIKNHKLYGTSSKSDIKCDSNFNPALAVPKEIFALTSPSSDSNIMSASTSGNDIQLTLNPIIEYRIKSSDSCRHRSPESDSSLQIICVPHKIKNKFESFNQEATPLDFDEANSRNENVELNKKVGFMEGGNAEMIESKNESIHANATEDQVKPLKRHSKRYSKSISKPKKDTKKLEKADCDTQLEQNEIGKGNIRLRRSKSDAIMSASAREIGETPSVKIQFTKDGIKVISDKESIV